MSLPFMKMYFLAFMNNHFMEILLELGYIHENIQKI